MGMDQYFSKSKRPEYFNYTKEQLINMFKKSNPTLTIESLQSNTDKVKALTDGEYKKVLNILVNSGEDLDVMEASYILYNTGYYKNIPMYKWSSTKILKTVELLQVKLRKRLLSLRDDVSSSVVMQEIISGNNYSVTELNDNVSEYMYLSDVSVKLKGRDYLPRYKKVYMSGAELETVEEFYEYIIETILFISDVDNLEEGLKELNIIVPDSLVKLLNYSSTEEEVLYWRKAYELNTFIVDNNNDFPAHKLCPYNFITKEFLEFIVQSINDDLQLLNSNVNLEEFEKYTKDLYWNIHTKNATKEEWKKQHELWYKSSYYNTNKEYRESLDKILPKLKVFTKKQLTESDVRNYPSYMKDYRDDLIKLINETNWEEDILDYYVSY